MATDRDLHGAFVQPRVSDRHLGQSRQTDVTGGRMKFNPRALPVLVGFSAVGLLSAEFAIVGFAAMVVVELLFTPLGYALLRHPRWEK